MLPQRPWVVLVTGEDPHLGLMARVALQEVEFDGRSVELVATGSLAEARSRLADLPSDRLCAVMLSIDRGVDADPIEFAVDVRREYGEALQILAVSDEAESITRDPVLQRYIAAVCPKQDLEPTWIARTVESAVRTFRNLTLRGPREIFATFALIFDNVTDAGRLDAVLDGTLRRYSEQWSFDYVFITDLAAARFEAERDWRAQALEGLLRLSNQQKRSGAFASLSDREQLWGCAIQPLGGRFVGAMALRQTQPPHELLRRELQQILRIWAFTREAILFRQIALQEQRVREDMHRERRESMAQMVSGISHEINTPLGTARTAGLVLSEWLQSERTRQGCEAQELGGEREEMLEALSLLDRNIRRVGELVQDFKKLSTRQLVDQYEEVDLAACVGDAVVMATEKEPASSLELRLNDQLADNCRLWRGFPGFLSQVITHLLNNAAQYAYDLKGGRVDVRLSSRRRADGAEFQIRVQDYGAGISAENQRLVFDAFFTTGRGTRGGRGLGLAIARNIVHSVFEGELICESTEGRGSTFVLVFSDCRRDAALEGEAVSQDKRAVFAECEQLLRAASQGHLVEEERRRLDQAEAAAGSYLWTYFRGHPARHVPRVPCQVDAHVELDGTILSGHLCDISEAGAAVVVERCLDVGTTLILKPAGAEVVLTAVVANRRPAQGDREGQGWFCGVRFGALSARDQARIKLFTIRAAMDFWAGE